ncbi:MAG: F0F1 ATP synthase subunit B [Candidatus Omnitrophica bacterium]|nr:F0F1 ATP synthase subunit B [Candidatus Omnitrophota bacterium]
MELLKLLNANLVVAQIICFLCVLWLLKRFLWKPTFTMLEERKARIQAEFKVLEDAKKDAADLKKQYEAFLAKTEEAAMKRLKEIESTGEVRAQEIRERARSEAERIVEEARKEISFQFAKSRDVLKGEIVDMVIKLTESMIQEKLSFEGDRKIVEGFLKEVGKTNA